MELVYNVANNQIACRSPQVPFRHPLKSVMQDFLPLLYFSFSVANSTELKIETCKGFVDECDKSVLIKSHEIRNLFNGAGSFRLELCVRL